MKTKKVNGGGCLMGTELQFYRIGRVPEMEDGDDCTM
jgi:hypothetical protein